MTPKKYPQNFNTPKIFIFENPKKYRNSKKEKPGIEPATPALQDIGLSPTPRR